ncbi:glycosyltransferase [Streptomyces sp. Q6]|uniref:Glycosyltransferase n=1 Tax=Streptomyces citrinus TaxID=3118173 RepID=A0ACD5AK05_9ACTN
MQSDRRPSVSVVTAVHAPYVRFLPDVWDSLRAQDLTSWEWLVQLDGPGGGAVAEALASCGADRDPRVRAEAHGTAVGPGPTRNIALARAAAPLVQNVDADDLLEPGALTTLTRALAARPHAGYAVGRARDLLPDGRLRDHPLPLKPGPVPRGTLPAHWLTAPHGYSLPVHPAGILWRRALLVELGAWTALHGMEDTGLLMAAGARATGVLVDANTLRYRKHAAQGSAQPTNFIGAGSQISLIRQRVAVLSGLPEWRDPEISVPVK